MNSCAASCCTCSPKASCASATSVFWPTGDAPPCCRFVFNCSAQHSNRRPTKTPVARTTSGAAPCVVDRWWSSKGSPSQKSNFALHHWSPLPHETTLSSSNLSHVLACSVPLRLAAEQIYSSNLLSAVWRYSLSPVGYRCLLPCSTAQSRRLSTPLSLPFNLHRARVRRNHGRLPSNGLIERAQSSTPSSTASQKRASD